MKICSLGLCVFVLMSFAADRFTPAPYHGQEIGGILGDRMRINLEGRLLDVDEKGITEGFHNRPGKHPWIGEHAGKFLHAAVNTWEFTNDARLKTLMDRIARSVIDGQLPDGYLGTYGEAQRWTSWDVWSHKYNLIGLLRYYEATHDRSALEASRKMGDLLIATFGPGKRDLVASGTHIGMAPSSVLEPICVLYGFTKEQRYLDFARYIVDSWNQPNGPKIVESLLTTGSVFKTANAKAYEMMSCLVGLVELYRITGEQQFLKAAQAAWNDIATKRLYITGTTSSHEHFQDDFVLPALASSDVGEGCATVTWLQLSWQLLRVTGEQKYADELERTIYNQLLAAQDPHNGNICYFTPMIGRKKPTPGINCCVSSEPRGISMIPQIAWGSLDSGVAVLLYVPGKATIGGVALTSETQFPQDGKVTLTVGSAKRFPLYLRVPQWTGKFVARAGGRSYVGRPGEYVRIDRDWKSGDRVEIAMEMTTHVVDGGKSYPGYAALQRGPAVMALETDGHPELHHAVFRRDLPLVPFMDTIAPRVWIRKTAFRGTPSLTAFGVESYSRKGPEEGSICDEDASTWKSTNRGKVPSEDWFAVELNRVAPVRRIVFRHGRSQGDGGTFAEKPRVEIRRSNSKDWMVVGTLQSYAPTQDGQAFELKLAAAVEAAAIRVIGRPQGYVSCAELEAY